MKYEITKDLETGNSLIDQEHRQLFAAINNLFDACQQGKGREKIESTARFLSDYVKKHFADEEALQMKTRYPGYTSHKAFHESYKKTIASTSAELLSQGASIAGLAKLNQNVGVLVNHIQTEDKRLAVHVKGTERQPC